MPWIDDGASTYSWIQKGFTPKYGVCFSNPGGWDAVKESIDRVCLVNDMFLDFEEEMDFKSHITKRVLWRSQSVSAEYLILCETPEGTYVIEVSVAEKSLV